MADSSLEPGAAASADREARPGLYDYAMRSPRLPGPVDESLQSADIVSATRLEIYRLLQSVRQFEKRVHDLFLENLVKGTVHLSLGMEAVATGFGARDGARRLHVRNVPRACPHPRSWSACGAHAGRTARRSNGILGGKGGSMHLTSLEHGVMGSYAIIGAHCALPTAPPGRLRCGGPTRSRSASSVTARRTSVPSTRHSTWPRSGAFRSYSSARTTSTWSTRRST